MAAANAWTPVFIADYTRRFAKPARDDFDAHRAIRPEEDLDLIFTYHERRRVSLRLTLQYDKVLYLLADRPLARMQIGRYVDIYQYPDVRIEVRANGFPLAYSTYDKLPVANRYAKACLVG